MKKHLVSLVLFQALMIPAASFGLGYRVTKIGNNYGQPNSINEAGQVVGQFQVTYPEVLAFYWDPDLGFQQLNPLCDFPTGSQNVTASDINNNGLIVGSAYGADSKLRAVRWTRYDAAAEALEATIWGRASSVNDAGQVAGHLWSSMTGSCTEGVTWDAAGARISLGRGCMQWDIPSSIGNQGIIVGGLNAYSWEPSSGITYLTDLPGGVGYSSATAVDNNTPPTIVGHCDTDSANTQACIWYSAAGALPIPGMYKPTAINDGGLVIGNDWMTPVGTAFIWDKYHGLATITSVLDPASNGWRIHRGFAVNNKGQIAGIGISPDGHAYPVRLEPVPDNANSDGDAHPYWNDCDDQSSSVYPGAPEILFDGIDQDCNGYDLTISVRMAEWSRSALTLTARATSNYNETANLTVDGYGPMTWNAKHQRWEMVVTGVISNPGTITVRGLEGAVSRVVEEVP